MYRLLIVDDEPFIADGLCRFFTKVEQIEFDVYKAYSAEEALGWLSKTRMDIVISDIQMPGMSGLEMVKQIKRRWPGCRIIFLSGYSEFDYVYTAMQYEVDQYLLKSQGDEAILAAVEKSIEIIRRENTSEELKRKAGEVIEKSRPLLQQEYIIDILQGDIQSEKELRENFAMLDIPLDAGTPVLFIGGRIDISDDNFKCSRRSQTIEGINGIFQHYMEPLTVSTHVAWSRKYMLWLVQPNKIGSEEIWKECISFIRGTLESIQIICMQSLNVTVSFVIDDQLVQWYDLTSRYLSMKQILTYHIGVNEKMVLGDKVFFDSYNDNNEIEKEQVLGHMENLERLNTYLECGQEIVFKNLLTEILEYLLHYGKQDIQLEIYHKLCLIFLERINRTNIRAEFLKEFNDFNMFSLPYEQWSESMITYFLRLADWIFSNENSKQNQKFDNLVSALHKYINENLDQDLSLVSLADKVYLNPVYLSRIYKQITGKNLSEYISFRRLNKAKNLLQGRELKISEITTAVGYESPAHFSRIFKKAMNMTPQEYRDSFSADIK